jgi:thiamine biosynthesis lipoprotein
MSALHALPAEPQLLDHIQGTRRVVTVMGTVFTVDVRDVEPSSPAVDEAVAWWRWVDDTFSTYRPDSAISQLGRGSRRLADCPAEVREVLELCEQAVKDTDGYFTMYPNGLLDPSGLVKGWSVEIASRMLRTAGSHNHCITAGGDLRCAGEPAPGQGWRLGIADPFGRQRVAAVVIGHDLAVATSGNTERGAHIIDPTTTAPATQLASVTLVGTDLTTVDSMATAAFAMGSQCRSWLSDQPDLEAFAVTADGESWITPGFPGFRLDGVPPVVW